jgi:hypothetical protein
VLFVSFFQLTETDIGKEVLTLGKKQMRHATLSTSLTFLLYHVHKVFPQCHGPANVSESARNVRTHLRDKHTWAKLPKSVVDYVQDRIQDA